jgi:general secretion pathway protein I
MVAVAILGLSLTVILSAQAGLYSGGAYAQHTSVATGLLRCRMTEIEERMLKLGYPEVDERDDGACCEDDNHQDMRCEWSIDRVELPDPKPPELAPSASGGLFGSSPPGADTTSGGGPLGTLAKIATNPQAFGGDAGVSSLASALKEGTGGMAGIESLAMAIVYPQLKSLLEASIRKVTVKVKWREGRLDRDISITQYVTRPMRGVPLASSSASGSTPSPPPPSGPNSGASNPFGGLLR